MRRRRRWAPRSVSWTIWRWLRTSGPASSKRPAARSSSALTMQSATSSAQIGCVARCRPGPSPGRPGSTARGARAAAGGGRPGRRRASWRRVAVDRLLAATARSASALARCTRERWCGEAPSGVSHRKRSAPARSAARSSRSAARPSISSIVARGWSRSVAARWTTVFTPRRAWRHEAGSERSPIASWTRTRSAPSRRGSRTRQRTWSPRAVRRRSTAEPTSPVAPVSSSTPGSLESRADGLRDR